VKDRFIKDRQDEWEKKQNLSLASYIPFDGFFCGEFLTFNAQTPAPALL
jgi:hypothetical protein